MNNFTEQEKRILLEVADAVIKYGLEKQQQMPINVADYPAKLQEQGASFITLEIEGNLRGCIGSLIAYQPLIQDVAKNTYAAAFCDSRFPPLTLEEYAKLSKHISILSKPEPIHFVSEQDLLRQLRPGIDGLILTEFGYRGTFLPAVWGSLPEPCDFLRHLKLKAGLPMDYWSNTIKIERYIAEVIE